VRIRSARVRHGSLCSVCGHADVAFEAARVDFRKALSASALGSLRALLV
jgi:hypothetical protein